MIPLLSRPLTASSTRDFWVSLLASSIQVNIRYWACLWQRNSPTPVQRRSPVQEPGTNHFMLFEDRATHLVVKRINPLSRSIPSAYKVGNQSGMMPAW